MYNCNTKGRMYFESNERAYDGYLKLKEYCKGSIVMDMGSIEYDDTPCVRFEVNTSNLNQMQLAHQIILDFARKLEGINQVVMPIMVEELATVWVKDKE
jgi:hypothetical protein